MKQAKKNMFLKRKDCSKESFFIGKGNFMVLIRTVLKEASIYETT